MNKMNYSNFDDSAEVVPANSAEIIDTKQISSLPTEGRQVGNPIANAISPVAAIASVANTTLGTISDISKCIVMVAIEKQRTKQVEAQAHVQIEESIQQTNRIRIQEKENMKRLLIQCKTDLAKKEQELKMLRETNRSRETEVNQNHRLYMEQLDDLNKIIENIMNDKNIIYRLISDMVGDSQGLETLLHSLNDINIKLVEISKEVVGLKKG